MCQTSTSVHVSGRRVCTYLLMCVWDCVMARVWYNWTPLFSEPRRCMTFNRPPWKHGSFFKCTLVCCLSLSFSLPSALSCSLSLSLSHLFLCAAVCLQWEVPVANKSRAFLLSATVRVRYCGFSSFSFSTPTHTDSHTEHTEYLGAFIVPRLFISNPNLSQFFGDSDVNAARLLKGLLFDRRRERVCAGQCVCLCVCVCVREREREREREAVQNWSPRAAVITRLSCSPLLFFMLLHITLSPLSPDWPRRSIANLPVPMSLSGNNINFG